MLADEAIVWKWLLNAGQRPATGARKPVLQFCKLHLRMKWSASRT